MDRSSTLVLEGQVDNLPSLSVNQSAAVDGALVLRISLPPNFSSYGVWHNYTIMTCGSKCQGSFREVIVEHDGDCASNVATQEYRERESLITIAVSFSRLPICVASLSLPPLLLSVLFILLLQ